MAKRVSPGGCLIVFLGLLAVGSAPGYVLLEVQRVLTWEKLLVVVAAVCLLCGAFVVTHVHPLTEDEVRELATKRRNRQITTYFTFRQGRR